MRFLLQPMLLGYTYASRMINFLDVLRKQFSAFDNKSIPIEDRVKMAEFFLKSNYIKFSSTFKHQISGTTIGTKFAPP